MDAELEGQAVRAWRTLSRWLGAGTKDGSGPPDAALPDPDAPSLREAAGPETLALQRLLSRPPLGDDEARPAPVPAGEPACADELSELRRECRRLEAELRRLERLLAAGSGPSITVDEDLRVAACSASAERLLGPNPVGSPIEELVAPGQELVLCRPAPAGEEPAAARLSRCAAPASCAVVRDAGGRVIGLLREPAESAQARERDEQLRSRLEALRSGRLLWEPAQLDPGDLLRRAEERVARLARAKRASIRAAAAQGLPKTAGEAGLLAAALSELLVNALRACPPGSELALAAVRRGRGVAFLVADRGPGMDADRLRRALAGELGGGLAFARAVCERHGSALEGASEPGGTTLWFTLPGKPEAPRPALRRLRRS